MLKIKRLTAALLVLISLFLSGCNAKEDQLKDMALALVNLATSMYESGKTFVKLGWQIGKIVWREWQRKVNLCYSGKLGVK